ncbi:MAG: hypothetical protein WBF77_10755 [Sulfurimonadaceae bacterium]
MKSTIRLVPLTAAIVSISLFYGCSGHTLQDLVDRNDDNSSPIESTASQTQSKKTPPSQNSALQSISPSKTASDDHEEYRYMQKNTNEWLKKEWDPLTESNPIADTNSHNAANDVSVNDSNLSQSKEDNSSFTLQHYVDKAEVYQENREKRDANKTKAASHVDKVNEMPGIGKKSTR